MLVALVLGCESIAGIRQYSRAPDAKTADSASDAPDGQDKRDASQPQCVAHLDGCESDGSCCGYPSAQCFLFDNGKRCSNACESNGACASGCCRFVQGRRGACGNADECGSACRTTGETCDRRDDCCGTQLCVEFN